MLQVVARGRPSPVWRRFVAAPDPAAGAGLTIPPATARAWQVLTVSLVFTTSGQALNRAISLAHLDGDGNSLGTWSATAAITATLTTPVSWHAGLGTVLAGFGGDLALPLPTSLYVMPGETLNVIGNFDAADQISAVRAVVLETDTGDTAHDLATEQRIRDHWQALHELISMGG